MGRFPDGVFRRFFAVDDTRFVFLRNNIEDFHHDFAIVYAPDVPRLFSKRNQSGVLPQKPAEIGIRVDMPTTGKLPSFPRRPK